MGALPLGGVNSSKKSSSKNTVFVFLTCTISTCFFFTYFASKISRIHGFGTSTINFWVVVSNMFYFHPKTLGKMNPFWRSYFSKGLVQPPTSHFSRVKSLLVSGHSCRFCWSIPQFQSFEPLSMSHPAHWYIGYSGTSFWWKSPIGKPVNWAVTKTVNALLEIFRGMKTIVYPPGLIENTLR